VSNTTFTHKLIANKAFASLRASLSVMSQS
jgi:hypothetical protein